MVEQRPVDSVGAQVARWLRASLAGPDGEERIHEAVIEASGLARGTFYNLLAGKGGRTTNLTLKKLADALGVEPPRIERRLTWEPPAVPESPRSILRAAQGLLGELAERLPADGEAAGSRGGLSARTRRGQSEGGDS